MADNKRALVVPAFETFKYKFAYPETKTDLYKLIDANEVVTFNIRSVGLSVDHFATTDLAPMICSVQFINA